MAVTSTTREAVAAPRGVTLGPWGHRPALDGLRAVAVYLVVLFHAEWGRFEGGFIGVDLFFVLSGFLVTNVLLSEFAEHGRIRLRRFYARRVRRLVPAASVTILGTAILMVLVANQVERLGVRADAQASSLWYANWNFIFRAQDYFAVGEAPSPFLHFWSLSIEEQFYVVFPLLIITVWFVSGRRLKGLVWVLAAVTAAGIYQQLAMAAEDPAQAYLATHARFYQLTAGATAGVWLRVYGAPQWLRSWGVRIALVSLVAYVLAATNLLPVHASARGFVATALALGLMAGLEATQGRLHGTLAWQPLQYLGRISYGTYLWHYPVLVAAWHVLEFDHRVAALLSGVLGTALAALSYDLIERPIRTNAWLNRFHGWTVLGGIALAVFVGVFAAPAILEADRRPMVAAARQLAAPAPEEEAPPQPEPEPDAEPEPDENDGPQIDDEPEVAEPELPDGASGPVPAGIDYAAIVDEATIGPRCIGGDPTGCIIRPGGGTRVHLIGDSHAGMLIPALMRIADANDLQLSSTLADACPWQDGLFLAYWGEQRGELSQNCDRVRSDAYDRVIPALNPDVIIAMSHPGGRGHGVVEPVYSNREDLQGASPRELLEAMTEPSAQRLAGIAPTVLIQTIPRAETDKLSCLAEASDLSECVFTVPEEPPIDDVLMQEAALLDRVMSINIDELVCPDLPVCVPIIDGIVVRRDAHHITADYMRKIAPDIARLLNDSGAFFGRELAIP